MNRPCSASLRRAPVNIVGAGPTGALLAILLQKQGLDVTLYESRKDPRGSPCESGRSINLALADRGIHALKLAGAHAEIASTLVGMRGRLIHERDGREALQLYGRRPAEIIYSISRHALNQALLRVAVQRHGVKVNFEHRLEAVDFERTTMHIRDLRLDRLAAVAMAPALAADGAGSVVRRCMAAAGLIEVADADLEHGYKELSIPTGAAGPVIAADVLHIWPRGDFMLIALPNADGSFTATLFLAKHGAESFQTLTTPPAIERFLSGHFPDVYGLMPDCIAQFQNHPTGSLGTVYAGPWCAGDRLALIGDSAHAMVPFHGQGMNCCFEDCVTFAACVQRGTHWGSVFSEFQALRKPNTDAIAQMALENYLEMRERVVDPKFRLQQMLALELERRHPRRFIPRYSMVMFHHEISYLTAFERGKIQTRLLSDLTADAGALEEVDYALAERRINLELAPLLAAPK